MCGTRGQWFWWPREAWGRTRNQGRSEAWQEAQSQLVSQGRWGQNGTFWFGGRLNTAATTTRNITAGTENPHRVCDLQQTDPPPPPHIPTFLPNPLDTLIGENVQEMSPFRKANSYNIREPWCQNGPLFCFLMTNYDAMKKLMQPGQSGALMPKLLEVCNLQKARTAACSCVRSNYGIQQRLASYYRPQAFTPSSFTCSLIFKLSSTRRIFCKLQSWLQSSAWG